MDERPFKAGQNEKKIFAEKGLKDKLKSLGKWGIGDGGYNEHPEELSIPNPHDSKEVARFKSRALKRHERFNGYTKAFDCLSGHNMTLKEVFASVPELALRTTRNSPRGSLRFEKP
jgi:hypothetical protein